MKSESRKQELRVRTNLVRVHLKQGLQNQHRLFHMMGCKVARQTLMQHQGKGYIISYSSKRWLSGRKNWDAATAIKQLCFTNIFLKKKLRFSAYIYARNWRREKGPGNSDDRIGWSHRHIEERNNSNEQHSHWTKFGELLDQHTASLRCILFWQPTI